MKPSMSNGCGILHTKENYAFRSIQSLPVHHDLGNTLSTITCEVSHKSVWESVGEEGEVSSVTGAPHIFPRI